MGTNYQEGLEEDKQKEELFKFYNRIKSTQAKCLWGAKDCAACEDKACNMRSHILAYSDR